MIRRSELYLIRNLELFRFRMMKEDYEKAEVAFHRLEEILKHYNQIDEEV